MSKAAAAKAMNPHISLEYQIAASFKTFVKNNLLTVKNAIIFSSISTIFILFYQALRWIHQIIIYKKQAT